jgi:EAL domain-containing protein (putative c-di-GMP-specific phosphodiesterase class I)
MRSENRPRRAEDRRDVGGGIVLRYRRVVALATGETAGAVAVPRPQHRREAGRAETCGVPPAEDVGAILSRAAADAARWPDALSVSVTVPPAQLAGGALIGGVAAALDRTGIGPERVELALMQSPALADDEDTLLALAALRDLGIGIALCDFGAGCADLATLKRLPLSALRLHRSLMTGVPEAPVDTGVLRAAVAAGRALGTRMVADGVETTAQRDFLAAIRVDRGQGFLFGPTIPAGALIAPAAPPELAAG